MEASAAVCGALVLVRSCHGSGPPRRRRRGDRNTNGSGPSARSQKVEEHTSSIGNGVFTTPPQVSEHPTGQRAPQGPFDFPS